ncbi:MAG: hypothetical protein ACI4PD_07805 [Butyricicoccus sp.]
MKELIALALCALMTLTPTACGMNDAQTAKTDDILIGGDPATWGPGNQPAGTEDVQIPSPFVDQQTLEDAAKYAGFTITVPEQAGGFEKSLIQAAEDDMIQVFYRGAVDGEEILIRKAAGDRDISGDYTVYDAVKTVESGARQITVRGDGDSVRLAVWTEGGYSFSVWSSADMELDSLLAIVNAVQ